MFFQGHFSADIWKFVKLTADSSVNFQVSTSALEVLVDAYIEVGNGLCTHVRGAWGVGDGHDGGLVVAGDGLRDGGTSQSEDGR
ncbi:hypothetical protein PG995_005136 [Apiospora arundinis]